MLTAVQHKNHQNALISAYQLLAFISLMFQLTDLHRGDMRYKL